MGILKRKKKVEVSNEIPSLDNIVQKKLILFITIVGEGQAYSVTKLFERFGSSAQFVQRGEGTASKEIYNILGLQNTGKDIIFSFISEDKIPEIKIGLEGYFMSSKRNKGIGMALPLSSIIGVRVYQFLADTVEGK